MTACPVNFSTRNPSWLEGLPQERENRLKTWFYRFTAAHFCVTAMSGVLLYFRPLEHRAGWYSEEVKEFLVGLHNAELWGQLLLDNPYLSGPPIGIMLAAVLIRKSARKVFAPRSATPSGQRLS